MRSQFVRNMALSQRTSYVKATPANQPNEAESVFK